MYLYRCYQLSVCPLNFQATFLTKCFTCPYYKGYYSFLLKSFHLFCYFKPVFHTQFEAHEKCYLYRLTSFRAAEFVVNSFQELIAYLFRFHRIDLSAILKIIYFVVVDVVLGSIRI